MIKFAESGPIQQPTTKTFAIYGCQLIQVLVISLQGILQGSRGGGATPNGEHSSLLLARALIILVTPLVWTSGDDYMITVNRKDLTHCCSTEASSLTHCVPWRDGRNPTKGTKSRIDGFTLNDAYIMTHNQHFSWPVRYTRPAFTHTDNYLIHSFIHWIGTVCTIRVQIYNEHIKQ